MSNEGADVKCRFRDVEKSVGLRGLFFISKQGI